MLKGLLNKFSKEDYKKHLFALIIVGGGGTRLWPLSKVSRPKQFLKLFNNQTLTQITSHRFNKILPWEKIYAVTTSEEYKKEILEEVPEFVSQNIIVEPMKRNTAAAHALGAIHILKADPKAVILNEAADHLVDPQRSYLANQLAAAKAVFEKDLLLAIGIKPTYPNTGYGYVKLGEKIEEVDGKHVFKLDSFTEKPELEIAKEYLASGKYFWNGNQYVWGAQSFINALEKHAPDIYKGMKQISDSIGDKSEKETLEKAYGKLPDLSVDYAVSEKAKNFIMMVADYMWTDIGDWKEVWENSPKDSNRNVVITGEAGKENVINIDTTDALIHTSDRLIAVVDVDNLIIVDTKDALLVTTKSRAQSVKKVVEKLKADKLDKYL